MDKFEGKSSVSAAAFRSAMGLPPAGPVEISHKGAPPKKKNKSKEKAALEGMVHMYGQAWNLKVEAEARFHPVRMWRFDWYFPEIKVAVEFEGLAMGHAVKSRHQDLIGYTQNCEKYNQAAIMGIKVLRYTALNLMYEQFATDIHTIIAQEDQKNFEKK